MSTFKQKIRYHFDNLISKGAPAHMGILFVLFIITSILAGVMVKLTGIKEVRGKEPTFFEAIWSGYTHAIDPGTIGGDSEWHLRIGMLLPTLMGIILVSSLVSILTAAFNSKLSELKRGRSFVVEKNHTVILGWSQKVITIIQELIIANQNQKDACVVLLSDADVDKVREELESKIPDSKNTRIVLRHGNPKDLDDIEITNINESKSIIIIAQEISESDAFVIKTLLAVINHPNRTHKQLNIVTEISDQANKEITTIAGKNEVSVVVSNDLIAKLTVQATRQTGLSLIYNDLIDFGNVEIYILPLDKCIGKTYEQLALGIKESYVIGFKKSDGAILLNPPKDSVFEQGDRVIVIAEDDSELIYNESLHKLGASRDLPTKTAKKKKQGQIQKTLILGWNKKSELIIKELDKYVQKGSSLHIMTHYDQIQSVKQKIQEEISNQTLTFEWGDIKDRQYLSKLPFEKYDDVIISSYSDAYGIQEADAITIICLMHLRDLAEKHHYKFNIVAEIMDEKNQKLASSYKVDDFIVSNQVISKVMTQLSENKDLGLVFEELFDSKGCEIYLRDAEEYIPLGTKTSLLELSQIGMKKHETCIGISKYSQRNDASKNFGLRLAYPKTETFEIEEGDKIIVITES